MSIEIDQKLLPTITPQTRDIKGEFKLNCWEFKKCGREPGGEKASELGICPATTEEKLHGVHGGKNAGRACWIVAGSMCGGKIQGTFAQKYGDCAKCDFFREIQESEGADFMYSSALLRKLLGDYQSPFPEHEEPPSQEKIRGKRKAVIEIIKHRTNLLTAIVLLIILTILFVNAQTIFAILDFIPSSSLVLMLMIVSGLVVTGFYLSRMISLNAIDNLERYSTEIDTLLIAKEKEIAKRKAAEENLVMANKVLEDRVKERTADLSKTVKILNSNIVELKRMEEQLYRLSMTDELTGLYNRRGFYTLAEHRLKLAKQQKIGLLLLYADIDNLKDVNDAFGHEAGDMLLKKAAEIFRATYRNSDIVARIGGDEFVVFPLGTTQDSVEMLVARLQENIEFYNMNRKDTHKLSISIGVSVYDHDTVKTIDGLLSEADYLMYRQKIRKDSFDAVR